MSLSQIRKKAKSCLQRRMDGAIRSSFRAQAGPIEAVRNEDFGFFQGERQWSYILPPSQRSHFLKSSVCKGGGRSDLSVYSIDAVVKAAAYKACSAHGVVDSFAMVHPRGMSRSGQ